MTSVRRYLPFAVFAVLATAWAAINIALYNATVGHLRVVYVMQLATVNARERAAGRPELPPDLSMNPMGWAQDWRVLGPGLLLLAGAALVAALLHRSVRGPWWVAALIAPAFMAGFDSMKQAWRYTLAGAGTTAHVTTDPTPRSMPRSPGVQYPYLPSPSWLIPAMITLGVLVVLAPALSTRAHATRAARAEKAAGRYFWTRAFAALRAFDAVPLLPAIASVLAVFAVQSLTSNADIPWRGPLGGALLVLAVALVLRSLAVRADRVATAPWLVLAAAGIIAGTTGVAAAQVATAVGDAGLALAAGAMVLVPWGTLRKRLNRRRPVAATQS
ncbi:MAG: hypothetical protein QOH99_4 [Frankiaceae bacterium]|nr:hypothetical protein [Frankiaceae bacterium]